MLGVILYMRILQVCTNTFLCACFMCGYSECTWETYCTRENSSQDLHVTHGLQCVAGFINSSQIRCGTFARNLTIDR